MLEYFHEHEARGRGQFAIWKQNNDKLRCLYSSNQCLNLLLFELGENVQHEIRSLFHFSYPHTAWSIRSSIDWIFDHRSTQPKSWSVWAIPVLHWLSLGGRNMLLFNFSADLLRNQIKEIENYRIKTNFNPQMSQAKKINQLIFYFHMHYFFQEIAICC